MDDTGPDSTLGFNQAMDHRQLGAHQTRAVSRPPSPNAPLGNPPTGAPPPSRTPVWLGLAAATAVIVLAAVGGFFWASRDNGQTTAAGETTSEVAIGSRIDDGTQRDTESSDSNEDSSGGFGAGRVEEPNDRTAENTTDEREGPTRVDSVPEVQEETEPEVQEEAELPAGPLTLPLTVADITAVTEIPIDPEGGELLNGPANAPQFCDVRPDITGLVETKAEIYPKDAALRIVVQRMLRFSTPDQAAEFVRSASVVPCDSWESTEFADEGVSTLTAEVTEPTVPYADQTTQIDQVLTLPNGFQGHSRTVFVRSGNDVLKLFYNTISERELAPVGDALTSRAIATLGY